MNAKELRELDAWIAEHVMGWGWWFNVLSLEVMLQSPVCGDWPTRYGYEKQSKKPELFQTDTTDLSLFRPTTSPADAFEVLKKCAEQTEEWECLYIGVNAGGWIVGDDEVVAETLELAICLFAKRLFEKV